MPLAPDHGLDDGLIAGLSQPLPPDLIAARSPSLSLVTVAAGSLALSVVLSGGAGFLGGLAAAFGAVWASRLAEQKRQSSQAEQDARSERAQTMRAARILDSALQEAEALLTTSVLNTNRLWVASLEVPDRAIWLDLRGDIAAILEPAAWIAVNSGFLALDHMRGAAAGYRNLGYDDTTDLTPRIHGAFEPLLRDIRAARAALAQVAYPDHIQLPAGHPMLALRAEQRAATSPPADESSPDVGVVPPDWEALR
jgi:hypothetical protein